MNPIYSRLFTALQGQYESANRFIRLKCPHCVSGSGRRDNPMRCAPESGFAYCFRCGTRSSLKELCIEVLGVAPKEAKELPISPTIGQLKKMLEADEPEEVLKDQRPPSFRLLPDTPKTKFQREVYEYLYSRDWDDKLIHQRHVGFSLDKSLSGRIIFPIYYGETMVYWQARSIYEEVQPKYKNPFVAKEGIIYGMEWINPKKEVVLVEGLFDTPGMNAGAILGKRLTEGKILRLISAGVTSVVLYLDGSADVTEEDIINNSKALLRVGIKCRVAFCSAKDPGEATLTQKKSDLKNAKRVGDRIDLMGLRLFLIGT